MACSPSVTWIAFRPTLSRHCKSPPGGLVINMIFNQFHTLYSTQALPAPHARAKTTGFPGCPPSGEQTDSGDTGTGNDLTLPPSIGFAHLSSHRLLGIELVVEEHRSFLSYSVILYPSRSCGPASSPCHATFPSAKGEGLAQTSTSDLSRRGETFHLAAHLGQSRGWMGRVSRQAPRAPSHEGERQMRSRLGRLTDRGIVSFFTVVIRAAETCRYGWVLSLV